MRQAPAGNRRPRAGEANSAFCHTAVNGRESSWEASRLRDPSASPTAWRVRLTATCHRRTTSDRTSRRSFPDGECPGRLVVANLSMLPSAPAAKARSTKLSGSSTKTSTRTVLVPHVAGVSQPLLAGSPKKREAPSTVRPTTPPRFHSSEAPTPFAYHCAAADASGARQASLRSRDRRRLVASSVSSSGDDRKAQPPLWAG